MTTLIDMLFDIALFPFSLFFFLSFITSEQRDLRSSHFLRKIKRTKMFPAFFTCINNFFIYACVDLYGKATDLARRLFASVAKDKNGYRSLKVSLTSILATIYRR